MPVAPNAEAAIWYDDDGTGEAGEAVLLVHGGLFDSMDGARFWRAPGVVSDLVAAGYRVLTPDRRFHGRTTAPFAAHCWAREASDLLAVVGQAGLERVHIVAGSNGCSAAVRLALLAPETMASLALCWPAAPRNEALGAAFELSAGAVERQGPAAYLAARRNTGIPRPDEIGIRPGFPWGMALLHDDALAASFCALSSEEAARIMRETGRSLLQGTLLRGLDEHDAAVLSQQDFPIAVLPAEPENPYHPLATAQALAAALSGCRLLPGFPETPTPLFPMRRAEFAATLASWLANASQ